MPINGKGDRNMPRNGSGIYSLPVGTNDFTPNTTIESSKIDTLSGDLESDANTARPIVVGGTGATTAAAALTNLGAQADLGYTPVNKAGDTMTGNLTLSGGKRIIGGFGAATNNGVLDWNDPSNARAGSGYSLLQGSTSLNAPDATGNYFHSFSYEYGNTGNLTQFAIPRITSASPTIHFRSVYADVWQPWVKVWTDGNDGSGSGLDADKLRGAVPDTNASANSIVKRDASGYGINPLPPAFYIEQASFASGTARIGNTSVGARVADFNQGSHVATSGIFTAPFAGTWLFSTGFIGAAGGSPWLALNINGNRQGHPILNYVMSTGVAKTITAYLSAGDSVDAVFSGTSATIYSAFFTGHLIAKG